ncbi:MAG TPA: urate hydroxylase PuuD [Thermoanaerobaculia bacterium]|nr:urate hydroxylase PuuD [Thermoanaerobaculia bacterium]
MNAELNAWLQLLFRWIHLVAGIAWIGHLWFFNWVNAPLGKVFDAATKKAVVPELMPRALYWFRWGAAWTWITGILLLGMVYYMGGALFANPNEGNMSIGVGMLVLVLIAAFLYDVIMRAMKGQQMLANALSLILLVVLYWLQAEVANFSGRALYIFIGGALGTAMAMNVWMRIWPAQQKVITAVKEGNPPDADLVAMATLRSRHNTFMSVPLMFFMISNHYPNVYGSPLRDVYAALIVIAGFIATSLLYRKSAKVAGF